MRFTCTTACLVCAAGLRVPHPPYIKNTSRLPIKTHGKHSVLSIETQFDQVYPPKNKPQRLQVLRATQLFPPFQSTPPHTTNRHDHQAGQADTWILSPPPEASCR